MRQVGLLPNINLVGLSYNTIIYGEINMSSGLPKMLRWGMATIMAGSRDNTHMEMQRVWSQILFCYTRPTYNAYVNTLCSTACNLFSRRWYSWQWWRWSRW